MQWISFAVGVFLDFTGSVASSHVSCLQRFTFGDLICDRRAFSKFWLGILIPSPVQNCV